MGDAVAQATLDKNDPKTTDKISQLNAEASIYVKRGEYERAEGILKKSLNHKPNQPSVKRLLEKISLMR